VTNFIIHIGDGKCGSTSIQRALYTARANLRAQCIAYETASPRSAHFNMCTLAGKTTRGNDDVQSEQARKTVDLIRATTGPQDTVLLSAESFFMLTPAKLIGILKMISTTIDRLDIIAYVRPPTSMYLSWVQQELKGISRYTKPDAYLRQVDQFLERWKDAPQKSSLTVRLYDRSRLRHGDVVEDFAEVLRGIMGNPHIHLQGALENASLSSEQLVVLQAMRTQFLENFDGKVHVLSNRLIAFFEAMNRDRLIGHPLQLTADALQVVGNRNAPVVLRLNRLFPDLAMPETTIDTATCADTPWAQTNEVQAILKTTDSVIVAHLKSLVPAFNADLRSGPTERSNSALAALHAQFGGSRAQFAQVTAQYWKQEGCPDAAAQLDATPADATEGCDLRPAGGKV